MSHAATRINQVVGGPLFLDARTDHEQPPTALSTLTWSCRSNSVNGVMMAMDVVNP